MANPYEMEKKKGIFAIGENGMLKGDGLPDGVMLDMEAYKGAISKYSGSRGGNDMGGMYPTMQKSPLSSEVTQFKVGFDGGMFAYVPTNKNNIAYAAMPQDKGGEWIPVTGLNLDESTKSGKEVTVRGKTFNMPFTIEDNQGSPLAVFGRKDGYMRLATQQAKTADNIRLGNNSGTTSSIRQNAQRRTLL
jgi:hypothetical protein